MLILGNLTKKREDVFLYLDILRLIKLLVDGVRQTVRNVLLLRIVFYALRGTLWILKARDVKDVQWTVSRVMYQGSV